MGEVKLSLEASSMKEIFEDLESVFEEMGAALVKPSSEIPEKLTEILVNKGMYVYKEGEPIAEELLKVIVEEDQEEVLEYLFEHNEPFQRIIEKLDEVCDEKGIFIYKKGGEIAPDLVDILLAEQQEEIIDNLLENDEAMARLKERLQEL